MSLVNLDTSKSTGLQLLSAPQSFATDSPTVMASQLRPDEEAFMIILMLAILFWSILPPLFKFVGTCFSRTLSPKAGVRTVDSRLLLPVEEEGDEDDEENCEDSVILQEIVFPNVRASLSLLERLQVWERKKMLQQREPGSKKGFEALGRWERHVKRREEERAIALSLQSPKRPIEGEEDEEVEEDEEDNGDDGRVVLWMPRNEKH